MPQPMKLCLDCGIDHRKNTRGAERVAPGHYSFDLAKTSSCTTCSTEARGFTFCLGCATERAMCQSCGHQFNTPVNESLGAQIAAHRVALEAARTAARADYAQTVEPFKDEVAIYEAAIKASEQTFTSACALLDQADRAAYDALGRADSSADREAASATYRKTRSESEAAGSRLYAECRERNQAAAAAFPQHKTYVDATSTRDKILRRQSKLFCAEVDRSVAIAEAEDSYARAVSLQDLIDRV